MTPSKKIHKAGATSRPLTRTRQTVSARKSVTVSTIPSITENLEIAADNTIPAVADTRAEFFKLMSEKIKAEEVDSASKEEPDLKMKSVNLYRKIAIRFIVLALILVAIVGYFTFSKLTIVVTPAQDTINDNLTFTVDGSGNVASQDGTIVGSITHLEEEASSTYPATGDKVSAQQFTGQVKITNNSSRPQPLVATTRLLTADNKLFRIKNSVNIPAGGSVMVNVYPDQPSSDMEIAPTHFTIPGLAANLQTQIYADSADAFSLSADGQKVISAADLDKAKTDLSAQLVDKAKQSLSGVNDTDQTYFDSQPTTATFELVKSKVGEVTPQFTAQIKNVVNVIVFKKTDVIGLASKKMAASLTPDKVLASINQDSLVYGLNSYDAAGNTATLNVDYSAQTVTSQTDFIDKSKLVNLDQDQLTSYLQGIKEVNSFDLKFFPPFIKRAPSLVDRINVEIK